MFPLRLLKHPVGSREHSYRKPGGRKLMAHQARNVRIVFYYVDRTLHAPIVIWRVLKECYGPRVLVDAIDQDFACLVTRRVRGRERPGTGDTGCEL